MSTDIVLKKMRQLVEVTFKDKKSFEIHDIPGIPNLSWSDNNIMALQIVYDRLQTKAIKDGVCLTGLQMCAHNPNWNREWNEGPGVSAGAGDAFQG